MLYLEKRNIHTEKTKTLKKRLKRKVLPQILTNARKKLIPARSFQGVKTRMVVMNALVKMDLKRQRKEHVQVIHYA